jgi:hypothetical protein
MRRKCQSGRDKGERGVALLIAIFALMLVSVVAIALIVSSGTDSALAGNFRSSANAYYAALAGLEEARGRLFPNNANCIELPPNAPPPPNTPCNEPPIIAMPLNQVLYITNPAAGEVVAPEATGNPTTYPDLQYKQEFGVDVSTRTVTKVASVSAMAGLPGPNYKWVRINAVTEAALGNGVGPGIDIDSDTNIDPFTPLFYDPENNGGVSPGMIGTPNPPYTAQQALEITSYAALPNGSNKMLQYIVRPMIVFPRRYSNGVYDPTVPTFPAALTLAGNNVSFTGPGTSSFYIRGQDQCSSAMLPAIGYTNSVDASAANISAGATPAGYYQGAPPMNPGPPPTPSPQSFLNVAPSMDPKWLTPSGLDSIVRDITNNADAVIQGPATAASFPPGMSATHPMTIVVNGDLDFRSWNNTGYGLLLVTGTLYYDPNATWEGVILVIGQGSFISTKNGFGGIDGAVFIAKTRDAANNLLPALGASSFSQTGNGTHVGRGISYNSCIAQSAQGPITYKIIAFKEIPLLN